MNCKISKNGLNKWADKLYKNPTTRVVVTEFFCSLIVYFSL